MSCVFFSSRRRHTRYWRDWSSDVCSSDLITRLSDGVTEDHDTMTPEAFEGGREAGMFCLSWGAHGLFYGLPQSALDSVRSGERRVGQECRSRWSPYH